MLAAILVSGWIGGLIPMRGTNARSPRFLSLGNAFAAGIFLGIGLIHMLGDASTTWSTSLGQSYPMGLLLAGAAFLLLLWFEHVALPGHLHHAVHSPGGVISNLNPGESRHAQAIGEHASQPQKSSALYPYALIVALSVHSLIAGIAMGAQSTLTNVVLMFLAIASAQIDSCVCSRCESGSK